MKIYLCGSMHGKLREKLILALSAHDIADPANHKLNNEADYTRWDLNAIDNCDAVVAFMDSSNPSGYGLNLEIGYAIGIGKKVIYLDLLGDDWRQKYFGMARSISTTVNSIGNLMFAISEIK